MFPFQKFFLKKNIIKNWVVGWNRQKKTHIKWTLSSSVLSFLTWIFLTNLIGCLAASRGEVDRSWCCLWTRGTQGRSNWRSGYKASTKNKQLCNNVSAIIELQRRFFEDFDAFWRGMIFIKQQKIHRLPSQW